MTIQQFIDRACLGIVTERFALTRRLHDPSLDPADRYRAARAAMIEIEERRESLYGLEVDA